MEFGLDIVKPFQSSQRVAFNPATKLHYFSDIREDWLPKSRMVVN